MARALASLTLGFGLVSIPVKLYPATESSAPVRFQLLSPTGRRVRQQYVAEEGWPDEVADDETMPAASAPRSTSRRTSAARDDADDADDEDEDEDEDDEAAPTRSAARPRGASQSAPAAVSASRGRGPAPRRVVEPTTLQKGFEFEKGRFAVFTPAELKALRDETRRSIDIVSFVPAGSVDPLYYDKAYFLGPDRGGARPYSLLVEALRASGRTALARWAWRSREHPVQIRPADAGLVLQQLRYADEVRSLRDLGIEPVEVGAAELALARQLIARNAEDGFDPARFIDEEKARILAAVERKRAGRKTVSPAPPRPAGADVLDLVEALRASLARGTRTPAAGRPSAGAADRKPARRSAAATSAKTPTRRPGRS